MGEIWKWFRRFFLFVVLPVGLTMRAIDMASPELAGLICAGWIIAGSAGFWYLLIRKRGGNAEGG